MLNLDNILVCHTVHHVIRNSGSLFNLDTFGNWWYERNLFEIKPKQIICMPTTLYCDFSLV